MMVFAGGPLGENRLDKVTLEGSHIISLVVLKEKERGEMAHVLSCRWDLCSVLKPCWRLAP